MDAVEFIKARRKMCWGLGGCSNCPFDNYNCGNDIDAETVVSVVENWVKAHPDKTRQSEFLKLHPNAKMSKDGRCLLDICPKDIDSTYQVECITCRCNDCKMEYWSKEVE